MEFREFRESTDDTEEEVKKYNKEESRDYSWLKDTHQDKEKKDYSWMVDDDEDDEEKDYSWMDVDDNEPIFGNADESYLDIEDDEIVRFDDFVGIKEVQMCKGLKVTGEKWVKLEDEERVENPGKEDVEDKGREPAHPNLKEDYFEKIDTKEKAYWLGFMFADGYIESTQKRIGIDVGIKDEMQLDKFIEAIDANKEKKEYPRNNVRIRIANSKLWTDLESKGCILNKSKKIEFPRLKDKKMELAFLLGFYDGDGQQGKTIICTGSKKFLEQIKEKFKLKFKIRKEENDGFIDDRKIHSKRYYLNLGANLFNKMMQNYERSMPRKRRHFVTKEERAKLAAEASRCNTGKPKFKLTKEELEKEVWEKPSEQIAKEQGVSGRLITKKCRQYGIDKPPRGYWAKKSSEDKKKIK
ncbi:MAG: hypothetical protein ACFFCS_18835 [Candidatus Hodarchaeota archaeon]